MALFTKIPLSGSTNGRGVLVATNASPGTLIHTAVSGTTAFDEIWLYAHNNSTSAIKVTVEYGSTSSGDNIELTVVGESGLILLVPGLMLNNAQIVRAFATTSNAITIHGYVNRVS